MPRKKDVLAPQTATSNVTQLQQPVVVGAPALAGAVSSAVTRTERNARHATPFDSLSGVTAALGARHWLTNAVFDWSRNAAGHRYRYTRWYMEKCVLVDVWANATDLSKREAQRKRDTIVAENERRIAGGLQPIGYLPVVRGAMIAPEIFDRVLAGEVLDMIERSNEGVYA